MNPSQEAKLGQFASDELMLQSVFRVIEQSFLKNRGPRDVQTLAAERLAIDLLGDAKRELESYRPDGENTAKNKGQIGL